MARGRRAAKALIRDMGRWCPTTGIVRCCCECAECREKFAWLKAQHDAKMS